MRVRKPLAIVLSVYLMTCVRLMSEEVDVNEARALQVDELFSAYNRPDSPGCAVGIIRDGELIYSKGFGSANLDHEVLNSPRTVFEIGSLAKSFTCACIAILLDQGRISPDDDIRRYVPELHAFDPPILIRHLVRCRSGLWAQWHITQLAGWSTRYYLQVSQGRLELRVNNLGWVPLDPTVQDEFVPGIRQNHDNRVLRFVRDQQQQVVGLSAALWRVKGVAFARVGNPSAEEAID